MTMSWSSFLFSASFMRVSVACRGWITFSPNDVTNFAKITHAFLMRHASRILGVARREEHETARSMRMRALKLPLWPVAERTVIRKLSLGGGTSEKWSENFTTSKEEMLTSVDTRIAELRRKLRLGE